jgi:hypothetical protein
MDVSSASNFLSASILIGCGISIVGIALVFLNNLVSKYWKPVRIFTPDSWKGFFPPHERYVPHDEITRIPPTLDENTDNFTKK